MVGLLNFSLRLEIVNLLWIYLKNDYHMHTLFIKTVGEAIKISEINCGWLGVSKNIYYKNYERSCNGS